MQLVQTCQICPESDDLKRQICPESDYLERQICPESDYLKRQIDSNTLPLPPLYKQHTTRRPIDKGSVAQPLKQILFARHTVV